MFVVQSVQTMQIVRLSVCDVLFIFLVCQFYFSGLDLGRDGSPDFQCVFILAGLLFSLGVLF